MCASHRPGDQPRADGASVGVMVLRNVASPSYLRTYSTPTSLDDLAQHRIIHYAPHLGTQAAGWEYFDGRSTRLVPMRSAVVVNGTDAYLAACLAGLGIIQTPGAAARQLIDEGLLVEVLADFKAAAMPVTLLYPHRRQLPPRVKAVLGWITGHVALPYTGVAGSAAGVRPGRSRRGCGIPYPFDARLNTGEHSTVCDQHR